jgi:hypothetical protein
LLIAVFRTEEFGHYKKIKSLNRKGVFHRLAVLRVAGTNIFGLASIPGISRTVVNWHIVNFDLVKQLINIQGCS